jgi:hypothetical protein
MALDGHEIYHSIPISSNEAGDTHHNLCCISQLRVVTVTPSNPYLPCRVSTAVKCAVLPVMLETVFLRKDYHLKEIFKTGQSPVH